MGKSPHSFLDPFKYGYSKSGITDTESFHLPALTEFRIRGSAIPNPVLSFCLLKCPKSLTASRLVTASSETQQLVCSREEDRIAFV